MNELLADIHVPPRSTLAPEVPHIDAGLSGWGRVTLAQAMTDQGLSVVFSRGLAAYDLEAGEVQVLYPEIRRGDDGYEVMVTPGLIAVDAIRAIRNTARVIGGGVPELNHPDVRVLTRDKVLTNDVVSAAGLVKRYATWTHGENLADALDAVDADEVAMKPRTGKQGKNVHLGSRQDMMALFAGGAFAGVEEFIIEPRLSMAAAMPVRARDTDGQALLDWANRTGAPKELRAYYFGDEPADGAQLHYLLRVGEPGANHLSTDQRVYLDQDSVPDELHGLTATVANGLRAKTGVYELHVAPDWALTETSSGDHVWVPMEVNGGEPQLVQEHEDKPTALHHAALLARQLRRVALAGTTLYTEKEN